MTSFSNSCYSYCWLVNSILIAFHQLFSPLILILFLPFHFSAIVVMAPAATVPCAPPSIRLPAWQRGNMDGYISTGKSQTAYVACAVAKSRIPFSFFNRVRIMSKMSCFIKWVSRFNWITSFVKRRFVEFWRRLDSVNIGITLPSIRRTPYLHWRHCFFLPHILFYWEKTCSPRCFIL